MDREEFEENSDNSDFDFDDRYRKKKKSATAQKRSSVGPISRVMWGFEQVTERPVIIQSLPLSVVQTSFGSVSYTMCLGYSELFLLFRTGSIFHCLVCSSTKFFI